MIKKCDIKHIDGGNCRNEIYEIIKVYVFHFRSGRITTQKWSLCRSHFHYFLETNGNGWFKWYEDGQRKAELVDYEILV